jgi:LuxR family transcriptional regulator, maltose regulon positive regulatory protein
LSRAGRAGDARPRVMKPATAATPRTAATQRAAPARAAAAQAAPPPIDLRTPRPRFRPGLVPRERLVARLRGARDVPLVLMVAPAGYGKTTALAEWAEQDGRPFAWLALQHEDGDPARMLRSIALALDEIEPVGRDVFAPSMRRGDGQAMLTQRLARSLVVRRRPFVLVLDDAHLVPSPAAFEALEVLVDHMPAGSHIALASRTEPTGLPVGRLRTQRRLAELRTRELAMTRAEAGVLLAGLGLRSPDIDVLVERTEGWPAGLYLAALSLREQPDRGHALARFSGDDRFVADYVRDELLAELPGDRLRFLRRTSVLEDLSGPLCDAVLARPGSGGTLRDLARSNLLLVPLDRTDGRYRYHGLFAEMLRGELRRLEPEYESQAHRRASAWHATHGDVERAIHHATAANDVGSAGELLWRVAPECVMTDRHAAVRRWLERFTNDQIATEPRLALAAATSAFAAGDRDRVEHWCAAAERGLRARAESPARGDEAAVAVLRAFVGQGGPAVMAADAAEIAERIGDTMPWRGICCLMRGVAEHLTGDAGAARAHLEDGARRAAVAAPVVQVLCLAQLGVAALDDGDAGTAEVSIARARRQVERLSLEEHPLCAQVLAASALDRAQRGRVDDARRDLGHGAGLLAVLTDVAPWYDAETRLLLARAALRLGDVVGARTLLAEAARIVPQTAAPVLGAWLEEGWARADSFSAAAILGPSSLTTAELRVLRLLPTHLSFREVAASLHVSANTIKTHAHAVYRKLDASSRTEAVANARQVGLLDA